MSAVDEILSQIPMSRLASQLGVDEATAEQATRQALPALLGGMEANAQDPRGAQSGDHRGEVVNRLGVVAGGNHQDLIARLLPLLAPIVMSYLAGRVSGGGKASDAPGAGGLGSILGGLLGGGRR